VNEGEADLSTLSAEKRSIFGIDAPGSAPFTMHLRSLPPRAVAQLVAAKFEARLCVGGKTRTRTQEEVMNESTSRERRARRLRRSSSLVLLTVLLAFVVGCGKSGGGDEDDSAENNRWNQMDWNQGSWQ